MFQKNQVLVEMKFCLKTLSKNGQRMEILTKKANFGKTCNFGRKA